MITGLMVVEKVRELAAAHPDNVYTKPMGDGTIGACFYTLGFCSDGSKGCIIGQALRCLGVEISVFKEPESEDKMTLDNGCTLGSVNCACDELKIERTEAQRIWLGSVQCQQDLGNTWAQAIAQADSHFACLALTA